MMKLNLIYWESDNFGDILNRDLVEELTGVKSRHKEWDTYYKNSSRVLLACIRRGKFDFIPKIIFPWQRTYVCIGSIISWSNKHSHIWGAGFMNYAEDFHGGQVYAVRGHLTNGKLKEMGYPGTDVFGDPALLLPLWIPNKVQKKYPIGIIPHWKEVDYFIETYGDRYKIIDLRSKNVQDVVEQILDCETILSTSLHGVIVPHAYGIPAIWIKKGYIDTDGFKFEDYFSSVNINSYSGFEHIDELLQEEKHWQQLFFENEAISLPQVSILDLQKKLLRVAPFQLVDKYLKLK